MAAKHKASNFGWFAALLSAEIEQWEKELLRKPRQSL